MAIALGTDVEYIGKNASGGMVLGETSTDKIGFYGATPIVRPSLTAATTTATTTTNEAAIVRITALLVNLGLCVTT